MTFSAFVSLGGYQLVNSVHKRSNNRSLVFEVVIRVEVEVLVRVCWFAINGDFGAAVVVYMNARVKKGKFTFLLRLVGELNVRIQAVDVLRESFDIILVDLHEGVVDIPEPHTRGIGSGGHGYSFKLLHVQVGYNRGDRRAHRCSVLLFVEVAFVHKVRRVKTR